MQQSTDDVGMALDRVMATMHDITPMEKQEDTPLDPILTAEMKVEGVPV